MFLLTAVTVRPTGGDEAAKVTGGGKRKRPVQKHKIGHSRAITRFSAGCLKGLQLPEPNHHHHNPN